MSATTRYNGDFGNFTQGTLYSVAQLKAFVITVKNAAATAQNLSAEDTDAAGEVDQVVPFIVKEVQPLMYQLASGGSSNVIHVIMDGHAVDATSLQARIQAMGTVNSIDISGTTVALGSSITVA